MFEAMAAREQTYSKVESPEARASQTPSSPRLALMAADASDLVTTLLSAPSADFFKVLYARSATVRASGSEIASTARFTNGSNKFITGRTAAGSSTTLHILSTIKQQVRLTFSALSFKPRVRTGSITARAGVSTFCTKTHPARRSTHL